MSERMPKIDDIVLYRMGLGARCPVCGDPNAFPLWVGAAAPEGCAHDESWMRYRPRRINSVAECWYQRAKAWQAAEFRKLVPDAFDANGNMKDDELARVVEAFHRRHPDKELVL